MRLVFALGQPTLALLVRMRQGKESIVVIDTLRNLEILPPDENDNSAIARAMTPWVASARQANKTLIGAHHMRKGAGDHGEGIAGGHALFGSFDIALELRRDNQANRRVIKGYARLIQPEDLMYQQTEDGSMEAMGSPAGVTLTEVRRKVFAVLDGEWTKTADVRERLDDPKPGAEIVRLALIAEAEAGNVERDPPLSVANAAGKRVRWRQWIPLT